MKLSRLESVYDISDIIDPEVDDPVEYAHLLSGNRTIATLMTDGVWKSRIPRLTDDMFNAMFPHRAVPIVLFDRLQSQAEVAASHLSLTVVFANGFKGRSDTGSAKRVY